MQRVIDEMAKAKGDVEKRYREKIPEIIRECIAFAYLGKAFTFDVNPDLEKRVNQRLVELGDEILADIEKRAKTVIKYADDEDDEDAILAYMKREQNGEDLLSRIDKHNSNFRYFLEGWMAIGMVNGLSQASLLNNIMTYMHNVYVSDLWQKAFREGYLSNAIRTQGYSFGKGILRSPIDGLTLIEQDSINGAFQYGRFLRFSKDGAIGYTIHRGSSFDCPYCDSFTGIVHPMTECLLPLHPRCVCYSRPVYNTGDSDAFVVNNLALYRKNIAEFNRLKADSNYRDLSQGKVNAAVMATHKGHKTKGDKNQKFFKEQLTSAQLEKLCQEECVRMGHSLVFANESIKNAKGNNLTSLDAYADWVRTEIRSITENGPHTITNSIRKKNKQIGKFNELYPEEASNSLMLYFHDPSFYNKKKIIQSWYAAGYDQGKPIEKHVKRIICVVKGYSDWVIIEF